MKQLIARIDEGLHAALKARAAAEGRSVNDLVREILERGVGPSDRHALVRARAAAAGLLVVPEPEGPVPPLDAVIAATRGSGTAVSEALADDRSRR